MTTSDIAVAFIVALKLLCKRRYLQLLNSVAPTRIFIRHSTLCPGISEALRLSIRLDKSAQERVIGSLDWYHLYPYRSYFCF